MERLALIEQLSAPASARAGAAPRVGGGGSIARYARFRHVAAFILVLAVCTAALGAAVVVIETIVLLRSDGERLAALGRVLAWMFATLGVYGLLKGTGEALLLLADAAELANSMNERAAETHADAPH